MLSFVKMQGIGNDFIVFSSGLELDWTFLAPRLCDRRFGIGADGILLVHPSSIADFRMQIFNSDGTEPEMCGNGLRCFARYLQLQGLTDRSQLFIETGAGVREVLILADGRVQVDMGLPRLERGSIPMTGPAAEHAIETPLQVGNHQFAVTAVSMGNPHAVVFVDELQACQFETYGPLLEAHAAFPRRANAEFVQVLAPDRLRVKVWERGVGATLACGTGACAVLVAAILTNRAQRQATIELPGGELEISWPGDHIQMTGRAERVFVGEVSLSQQGGR